jgi:hypothetical protein
MSRWIAVLSTAAMAAFATAQGDGFEREGKGAARQLKDALEGKAPPALAVGEWLNAEQPPTWENLHGKVVLIDFWGVW